MRKFDKLIDQHKLTSWPLRALKGGANLLYCAASLSLKLPLIGLTLDMNFEGLSPSGALPHYRLRAILIKRKALLAEPPIV